MCCFDACPVRQVLVSSSRWSPIAISHQEGGDFTAVGAKSPLARKIHGLDLGIVNLAKLTSSEDLGSEVLEHAPSLPFKLHASPIARLVCQLPALLDQVAPDDHVTTLRHPRF